MSIVDNSRHPFTTTLLPLVYIYKSREDAAAAAPLSVLTSSRSAGSSIPGGKIEVSSSLRVINNRYIIGERRGRVAERNARARVRGGLKGGRKRDRLKRRHERAGGCERAAQLISAPRKEGGERGERERTVAGRGSDLHKYIEFIEMSLGIAARRILAAYQPPRRFIPSSLARAAPSPSTLFPSSSSFSLAFIKIARLIYAAR